MIHLVTAENESRYRDEIEQVYRLRHKTFVDELGWDELAKPDGRETDQFDTKHAVHMLYIEKGEVLGYQRLLPSTRPHLLSDIMPELCQVERPVGPHIWELTRFCVDKRRREKSPFLVDVVNALASALVEWGLEFGISQVIVEIEPAQLLPLVQLHFHPMPLGLPLEINGRSIIAMTLAFDWRTLDRLRRLRGNHRTVLAEPFERPIRLHA